jgi:MFS family permease
MSPVQRDVVRAPLKKDGSSSVPKSAYFVLVILFLIRLVD